MSQFRTDAAFVEDIPDSTRKAREQNPALSWRFMAGMRDVLIHDYFGVDLEVLWKTIEIVLEGQQICAYGNPATPGGTRQRSTSSAASSSAPRPGRSGLDRSSRATKPL